MLQSTVSPGLVQDAPKPPLVMPPEVESGRHWNLTADQEVKLKAMWAALFDIFGVKHERGQGEEAATPVQKKKWSSLLPRLGSGQQDDNMSSDGYESANKQDYSTAITTYSPEQLREAFWAMPKSLHPDELLLRFLRARKWNVQAAVFMFIPAITWINQEMDVHNDLLLRGEEHAVQQTTSTDAAERAEAQGFMAQLRTGKWFVHGTDNCGRPCLYIKAKLHHQSEQSADCLVRSIVYLIEMMRMMMPSPVDMAVSPDLNSTSSRIKLTIHIQRLSFSTWQTRAGPTSIGRPSNSSSPTSTTRKRSARSSSIEPRGSSLASGERSRAG